MSGILVERLVAQTPVNTLTTDTFQKILLLTLKNMEFVTQVAKVGKYLQAQHSTILRHCLTLKTHPHPDNPRV